MKHIWIPHCFFESSLLWLHSHVHSKPISFMVSDISVVRQNMSNMLVLIQPESILYYCDLSQLFSIMSCKKLSCEYKVEGDKYFQTCSNTWRGGTRRQREEGGKNDTAIGRNKKREEKKRKNLICFQQANTSCMQRHSHTMFNTL